MGFKEYNMNKIRNEINSDNIYQLSRKNAKDFTRNRKLTSKDLIYYSINNRRKTTKMEIYDYIKEFNLEEVSDAAMLKQREKLNENIFKILNQNSLRDFYELFTEEVKTYKGYILTAIDGSDCEVPNTPITRERYKSKEGATSGRVARIKLSNCYDILNNYVLDTEIEEYKHSENELADRHMKKVEEIIKKYPVISIRDRGYLSLPYIFNCLKDNKKFVIRLNKRYLQFEQNLMTSNDEWIDIQYQYDRMHRYIKKDEKLYELYKQGKLKMRFVNVLLPTGEVETIITNLESKNFSTEDINYIYQLRWGIETSYAYLKESMMITNISSSKECIIKQEIYSQMMVYNIMQSIVNDLENKIEQEKYKHKMKININMAIGFVKRFLVKILIEENETEREKLSNALFNDILKNIVPIRKNRNYTRNVDKVCNKHPITKRKSI